jgi:DNA-binding MarR family transcriptional regulator
MDWRACSLAEMTDDAASTAREFGRLFPAVYLRFHRRDDKRSELSNASQAVLQHLSLTGPLTIGEMAKHLGRAQSVVSEIALHLERSGLLDRTRDPRDRRKVLVWLSEAGLDVLERARQVLSRELLERTMAHMTSADRRALVRGVQALLAADRQVEAAAARPGRRKP